MKGQELRLCIDTLGFSKLDPKLMGVILQESNFLSVIQLWADQCSPNDLAKMNQTSKKLSKGTSKDIQD